MKKSLTRYRAATDRVVGWALDDLTAVWDALDVENNAGWIVRDSMIEAMDEIVPKYEEIVSGVASDWYSEVRAASGVIGEAPTAFPENISLVDVQDTVHRDARFLWDRERDKKVHGKVVGKRTYKRDPDAMLRSLKAQLSRFLEDQGRWTITEMAANDSVNVKWRRVARPTACAWCKEMSAEGWQWPGRERAEMNLYHEHCKCIVEPAFEKPVYVAPF